MKETIKSYLRQQTWFRPIRLARRARQMRVNGHPDWTQILRQDRGCWQAHLKSAKTGAKVLIATSTGGHSAVTAMESLLAVALTLRGMDVHVLLCDAALPACMLCEASWYPQQQDFLRYGPSRDLCNSCFGPASAMYHGVGLQVHRYGQLIDQQAHTRAEAIARETPLEQIQWLRVDGIDIGEHAMAGTLRFFARGDLAEEPHAEAVMRRYLHAALLTHFACARLFDLHGFEAAVFHHGIYVPQGIVGEVARSRGVHVVNWYPAYRKRRFLFSHGDTYHKTETSEPVEIWEKIPWDSELEAETLRYLESRWTGTEDWIWFHQDPSFEISQLTKDLGIDLSKPCIGLLTNVIWDAQLHYPLSAFPSMLEWLMATVRYFRKRSDLQLLIRVHPAEVRGALPSRQRVVDELARAFPKLPPNVHVIAPESRISTYMAMSRCDSVLIYGTKMGIELASQGIPVIAAGEAFVRDKGISLDADSVDEYYELLDRLPFGHRLDGATLERARKYAFHFFFRRMIPLECMDPRPGSPPYRIALDRLESLLPGRSLGLDLICDGILKGTPFVYPAESLRTRQV